MLSTLICIFALVVLVVISIGVLVKRKHRKSLFNKKTYVVQVGPYQVHIEKP